VNFEEGYDITLLRQFVALFLGKPLSTLLKGYFRYMGLGLSNREEEEGEADGEEGEEDVVDMEDTEEDPFDTIIVSKSPHLIPPSSLIHPQNAFPSTPSSILAHRILASVYLLEADYANAITVAERGLELVSRFEVDNGTTMNL
jgi:superkiller protein 3